MTHETKGEICLILSNAKLNFGSEQNNALNNDYLAEIFHNCPFAEESFTTKPIRRSCDFSII